MSCNYICSCCTKRIARHAMKLKCDCCSSFIHSTCTTINKQDIEDIILKNRSWSCWKCNELNFAFNNLDDNDFFDFIRSNCSRLTSQKFHFDDNLVLPFEINDDYNPHALDQDIDPDANFFNIPELHLGTNSNYYLEDDFNSLSSSNVIINNSKLSLFHLNIRSLRCNNVNLLTYLQTLSLNFNVICLTETWLHERDKEYYNLPGYTHVSVTRTNSRGGGISVFIDKQIEHRILPELCIVDDVIECLFVELYFEHSRILVGTIYRPPGTNLKEFNERMDILLFKIKGFHIPCYLLGDFNINLMNYSSHQDSCDFINNMYANSFIPLINRPTRVTEHSATLIDHIYTNNIKDNIHMFQGILVTDISDHYAIFHVSCFPDVANLDVDEMPRYSRMMKESNYSKFFELSSELEWNNIHAIKECKPAFSFLYKNVKSIYDKAFPLVKLKSGYYNKLPWLTQSLKVSIKTKNKLYKKYYKHRTVFNKREYQLYKSRLEKLMKIQEKQYYNDLIENNKNNMKKVWDTIKQVINKKKHTSRSTKFLINNNLTDDKDKIVDHFNRYFATVGYNLAKSIPNNENFRNFLTKNYAHSIYLEPVEESEIMKILNTLKNSAPGADDIKAGPIKHISPHIVKPLTYICQLSLDQGYFPDELKLSKIIPLYKANDPSLFSNYRPISLLSVFSKIMEKTMYNRIYSYLTKYSILYAYQFGFQENRSTYMAIICMLEKLVNALENGEFGIGVFIDFRKAFDTVDHGIILEKLYYYGIRGSAHDWMKSYLSNREQYLVYNETASNAIPVNCGVPQGSNLGPLLFLLYINDLAFVSPKMFAILFADDSNFFATGNDINELAYVVNTELNSIVAWLNANKMSFFGIQTQ